MQQACPGFEPCVAYRLLVFYHCGAVYKKLLS